MIQAIQRNFLFLWILVLLSMALVLSLTFAGCSSSVKTVYTPASGQATSPAVAEQPKAIGCEDTDKGIDTTVDGEVVYNGETYRDKCVSPFIIEYYCENGNLASKNIRCECSRGICKTNTTSS
jgi:hypothetical protein